MIEPGPQDVLLVIDVQNDFCPGGNLAVPRGDEVVPLINRLAKRFAHVVLTPSRRDQLRGIVWADGTRVPDDRRIAFNQPTATTSATSVHGDVEWRRRIVINLDILGLAGKWIVHDLADHHLLCLCRATKQPQQTQPA